MEEKDHTLTLPDSGKIVQYRAGKFSKGSSGRQESSEVIYSFRHAGDWLGDASDRWKEFRASPGMFKIQISRQISSSGVESLDVENSPSIPLLEMLIEEIDRRANQGSKESANSISAGPSTATKG